MDFADDRGAVKALAPEDIEHVVHELRRARDEQASARLRIRQNRLLHRAVRGQVDEASVSFPVARRAAGDESG